MRNDDFSEDFQDDLFEVIMKNGSIPTEFNHRLSKEEMISEKLNDLKIATKRASDMELDFLITNLEYLLDTMLQNDSVRRDFEYRKELRKF